ncbi:uncharacterized protein LOC135218483 [Macrobrachium nipponense]|uniref:uncharacterized protein LOC135218483 n=1 Tax=Macrobrachium nipponense TaxID=159736 RepID=UPI0030C87DE1
MKVPVFAVLILGLWTGLILAHRGGHGRGYGRRRGSGKWGGRRHGYGGYYGGRQNYNYVEGPTTPVSTTVTLAPGTPKVISSSGYYRPGWTNYTQKWNVVAPGNTISVTCTYQFSSYTCQSPSLTVGEARYTNGYQTIGPTQKQDSLDIVYANQGGECLFACIAEVPSSATPVLPLDLQNPESWYLKYPKCGGSRQSPVNIDENKLSGSYPWKELGIHQYDTPLQSMNLSNDGRSVVLRADGPFVMGGNLSFNSQYLLQDVVFHWGPTTASGSEHTINGQRYDGEIQFIHYNKKYASYNAAIDATDGLAILAVFLKDVQLGNNSVFNPVISAVKNVRTSGSSTIVEPFSLRSLLPNNTDKFYRYEGSLTSPGCQESATWTVFRDTVQISSAQLAEFRQIEDSQGNKITNNVRPVQDLNSRSIYTGQLQPSWSYNGPDGQNTWPQISASCGGNKQSPINIATSSTVKESWSPLVFTNFNFTPMKMVLLNNDNGAVIVPSMEYNATVQGGPFETPYKFFHYHFHWGSPDTNGSEHTIDGKRYPGEIHMLVYNQSLDGLRQSLGVEKGIYEVSVFLEFSDADNPKLANVISGLEKVVLSLSSNDLTPFPLENLLPSNRQDFYLYDGSITTPSPMCDEKAYSLVFSQPITISRNQMERFYNLENAAGYKIRNNFRNLQPLNGRMVLKS